MRRNYHAHAIRSMYHRFKILQGDRRTGMTCLICNTSITTLSHYAFRHHDYYLRALQVIESRRYDTLELLA